jgi:hypothetical protein
MVKQEKTFVECETKDVVLGEPVVLRLSNGDRVRTSPVEDYTIDVWGKMVFKTRNTIYRKA